MIIFFQFKRLFSQGRLHLARRQRGRNYSLTVSQFHLMTFYLMLFHLVTIPLVTILLVVEDYRLQGVK